MRSAVVGYKTANIGDDMQSLAARRFLDGKITYLQREKLNSPLLYARRYKMILNGWFMNHPERWPPSPMIDPLVISLHISTRKNPEITKKMLSGKGLEWFKFQAARRGVGTRDASTLRLFQEAGVEAYLSGCLTMTMKRPENIKRNDEILMIDVDEAAASALSSRTKQPFRKLAQRLDHNVRRQADRLKLVTDRFHELCAAKAVVTRRIHVAFPCLAVGTPVLMVHSNPYDARFDGIIEHLHFAKVDDVVAHRYDFDFDNPPGNKGTHFAMVREMERRCESFAGNQSDGTVGWG